jgi:single-strand DNA-binding protein
MSILKSSTQLRNDLVANPVVINLDSGKKFIKFSIATNAYHYGAIGEEVTNTHWHSISA